MSLHEALKSVSDYEIHWITLYKDIEKPLKFTCINQIFHVLPATKKTVGLYSAYWYNRRLIKETLDRLKPEIVHAWGTEDCYGLAIKDFKGKSILSMQGVLKAYIQRGKMSIFERIHSIYEPIAIHSAQLITTESSWAAERVKELSPTSTVKLWEYAAEKRFFNIKRELSAEPLCIMAGTNTPIKDVATAVAAFSKQELQHVKLYLAGVNEGDYANLTPNIIPLGRVSRERIAKLLASAWCLVHPSLADSSPNIVKEARVVGVAAIVTSECGGKQYIEQGQSGFIIPPKDVNELVKAVLHITQSRATAVSMGQFGQEQCRKALNADTMISGLIDIYSSIL